MLKPWWERLPKRLDFELEALQQAGIEFARRDDDFLRGLLVLDLEVTVGGSESIELRAEFPDLYPYTRPEVYAPDLALARHQNPFFKNLCLLGRRSDAWSPEMTLAELVLKQLPLVLGANKATGQEEAGPLEEHQGEPITAFYEYAGNAAVIIGQNFSPPVFEKAGQALFARLSGQPAVMTVANLRSPNGDIVVRIDPVIATPFGNEFTGRWVRLETPIYVNGGKAFDDELVRRHPELGKRQYVSYGNDALDHILIGFPDELRWFEQQLNWVMLVRKKRKSRITIPQDERLLVRAQRVGVDDRATRVPEAGMLATKRIAILGVGCLGAPLALQFARCGVQKLFVVDCDVADAAGSVRWPLGLPVAGHVKVDALRDFIQLHYPWTAVTSINHRIGFQNPSEGARRDADVLDEVFTNADIVVDATAEFGLQRMLSDFALEMKVPYIGISATLGALGGQVIRINKGQTGCWRCIRLYEEAGDVAVPPTLPDDSLVQPAGCDAATYIGGSFDLEEVSLMAVRLAIRTLAGNAEEDFPWDVATLSLRDAHGKRIPPLWSTARTPPHKTCPECPAA